MTDKYRDSGGAFDPNETTSVRMPRVAFDLKIPLWGVLLAVSSGLLLAINMWTTLIGVSKTVGEMQATLQQVVNTNSQLVKDQALTSYRLDKLEGAKPR